MNTLKLFASAVLVANFFGCAQDQKPMSPTTTATATTRDRANSDGEIDPNKSGGTQYIPTPAPAAAAPSTHNY